MTLSFPYEDQSMPSTHWASPGIKDQKILLSVVFNAFLPLWAVSLGFLLYFLIEHDYCVSRGHSSGGKCQLDSSMMARRGRSGVEGGQMGKKRTNVILTTIKINVINLLSHVKIAQIKF